MSNPLETELTNLRQNIKNAGSSERPDLSSVYKEMYQDFKKFKDDSAKKRLAQVVEDGLKDKKMIEPNSVITDMQIPKAGDEILLTVKDQNTRQQHSVLYDSHGKEMLAPIIIVGETTGGNSDTVVVKIHHGNDRR
jgi:hypothetical protein